MAKKKKTIAQSKAEKKNRSPVILVLTIACILVGLFALSLIGGAFYLFHFDFNGTILENVSIAGVDVGGMTRREAISAVSAATGDTYTRKTMTVKVLHNEVQIEPELSQAQLNATMAVWDAYRYGRRGFASQVEADRAAAAADGITVDITPYLSLDKKAIREALNVFSQHYSTNLSQTTYEITGEKETMKLVIHMGVPEYGLDPNELFNAVMQGYNDNEFFVEGQCGLIEPDPLDLDEILKQHYIEPVDAKFDEKFQIIEGTNGYGFDAKAIQKKLEEAEYGTTVEIPFTPIAPAVTGEMLSAKLFCDELGKHTASQSSSSNRQTNLRLACEAINGIIINPGETFSYNQTLGERTAEKGYKPGASYSGGETITTIGGGICQVSSTLYYCCLQADLEILARECHSYAPGYVPLGMDATVNWGTLDFSFRNDKDYPIRIDAVADGGSTTITLMGTDTKSYYIEMEYVVTAVRKPETKYETMKADNPKGYKDGQYITSPATGYDVVTYRCKYDKQTKELISREEEDESEFIKRDAVICKIEKTTPEATTPGETTPPAETTPDTEQPGIGNGGVTDSGGELPE